MANGQTSINLSEGVRDELRRYKAEDGLTYDEAIAELLVEVGWIDSQADVFGEAKQ